MEKCEEDVELVWPDENIPNVILSAQVKIIWCIFIFLLFLSHSWASTQSGKLGARENLTIVTKDLEKSKKVWWLWPRPPPSHSCLYQELDG